MLFGELIKSLSDKARINPEDETLKKLLANKELSTLELPDEFTKPLEENLLTEESALANQKVRSPLFAQALNGLDVELNNMAHDLPFDDMFKGDIKSITTNTHDKARKLTGGVKKLIADYETKLKEAKKNPANTDNTKEIENLNSVINGLNREMENMKVSFQGEIENHKTQNLNDRKNFALRSSIASRSLPDNGLPQEVNILTAETLVKQEMAKKGLQLFFDDFGNTIIKQKKDGTDIDYFVDNKKVEYPGFLDGVLAQNKFVRVNNDGQSSQNGAGKTLQTSGADGKNMNLSVVAETQKLLDQLGATV